MKAYKLFHLRKDGTLGSLFIGRKRALPLDVWLIAQSIKTKGYAYRPGWHCTHAPEAPHLKKEPVGHNRVWCEVEIRDNINTFKRPKSQGGVWFTAQEMRIVEILG